MTSSYSSIKPVCEEAQDPSMSAAVNNHQLPSYMSGFLYPLGNKKGVYSFVRWVALNGKDRIIEKFVSFVRFLLIYSIVFIIQVKFTHGF